MHVQLKLSKRTVVLDEAKMERVANFLNYTFTNVLRLQKYLMLFDPNASENSYMIAPVKIGKLTKVNNTYTKQIFLKQMIILR